MHERPYNKKLLLRDSDIYFKKHCIRVNANLLCVNLLMMLSVFSIKENIKARINLGVAGLPFHSFAKSGIAECDPKLQQTLI